MHKIDPWQLPLLERFWHVEHDATARRLIASSVLRRLNLGSKACSVERQQFHRRPTAVRARWLAKGGRGMFASAPTRSIALPLSFESATTARIGSLASPQPLRHLNGVVPCFCGHGSLAGDPSAGSRRS